MTASTIYLITKMTSPNRDDWYQDGINAFVIDYIKKAESIESEIQVYKYEFVITNLNIEHALTAQLKNVIVGEDDKDGELLFYTTITYKIDNGEN